MPEGAGAPQKKFPKSLKELTPAEHFSPGKFFNEMVLKTWLRERKGQKRAPAFPKLKAGEVALTWIGHASFLVQFPGLNILIDPNFSNWLFLIKRLKHSGFSLNDLPPVDLVLLTHAHFDHLNKATLRRLPSSKVGVMPWGVGKLTKRLGFSRVLELKWWESFSGRDWSVTLVPAKHWGARYLRDLQRGYGGFVISSQGRTVYHAGDTAYFDGFAEIGRIYRPEIALLPIGACQPESFRKVHMGPDESLKAFRELKAKWLVPMHYGSFKLGFEDIDEPPRWLRDLARSHGLSHHMRFLEEGRPVVF